MFVSQQIDQTMQDKQKKYGHMLQSGKSYKVPMFVHEFYLSGHHELNEEA